MSSVNFRGGVRDFCPEIMYEKFTKYAYPKFIWFLLESKYQIFYDICPKN